MSNELPQSGTPLSSSADGGASRRALLKGMVGTGVAVAALAAPKVSVIPAYGGHTGSHVGFGPFSVYWDGTVWKYGFGGSLACTTLLEGGGKNQFKFAGPNGAGDLSRLEIKDDPKSTGGAEVRLKTNGGLTGYNFVVEAVNCADLTAACPGSTSSGAASAWPGSNTVAAVNNTTIIYKDFTACTSPRIVFRFDLI